MRLPGPLGKLFGGSPGAEGESPAGEAHGDDSLPIPGYDQLSAKEITGRLRQLAQVDLAVIEDHERSHRGRAAVLTKLGYMREDEPLPGYDAMDSQEVILILTDADSQTVRTVRDYERKFQHRRDISEAVTRLLPKARSSDSDDRQESDRAERISAGHRSMTAAGERLSDARSNSGARPVKP